MKINETSSCSIEINRHKSDYMSIYDYLNQIKEIRYCYEDEPEEAFNKDFEKVIDKIKETDTIIEIQVYPQTPIGFYTIYHYDYDMALKELNDLLKTQYE